MMPKLTRRTQSHFLWGCKTAETPPAKVEQVKKETRKQNRNQKQEQKGNHRAATAEPLARAAAHAPATALPSKTKPSVDWQPKAQAHSMRQRSGAKPLPARPVA
jgi:hypothetical protein